MVHLTLDQLPLKVVHDWLKSEYQTKVPDPYLIAQRRAELGMLEVLLKSNTSFRYIHPK